MLAIFPLLSIEPLGLADHVRAATAHIDLGRRDIENRENQAFKRMKGVCKKLTGTADATQERFRLAHQYL